MGKRTIYLLFALTILSFNLSPVSDVFGQPENVKVLSHSWYIDSLGYFVVVGEIQNVGPNTIDSVILSGTVYTSDGAPQANSYARAFVKYLTPQQKAPFYMEFPGDISWISLGLDRVEFMINQAEATASYQYPYLIVRDRSAVVAADGVYWVSGSIQNTGSQVANKIRVVGTFYNASGTVVAVGYTDILTPVSLAAAGTATFKVGAFDLNQTQVPSSLRISSYSLLVQTEEPILSGTAPPPAQSSTTQQDSNSPLPSELVYAVVAVAAIIAIAGGLLLMRRREPQAAVKRKPYVKRRKK